MFKRSLAISLFRNILLKYSTMAQESGDALLPDIKGMRAKYHKEEDTFLEENLIVKEPFGQFKAWFDEACQSPGITEANAMCLATASKDGSPSARYVLLKDFGKDGFTFFTNYKSRKAQDLEENPKAALTFLWEPLHRSVRIEGYVNKISASESDEYFKSRPRDSQIGSSASLQSSVIESRTVLIEKQKKLTQLYEGQPVPRPDHWGGYKVVPTKIEFWSGQSNRLHDRIVFRRTKDGEIVDHITTHIGEDGWVYERLSP